MTISSSLNAGVSGLTANATRLATISDNIANSATYGYKRVEADFQSLVLSGREGTYSAGGTLASTLRLVDQRGPIVSTNNPTDLATTGRGMIPVAMATEIAAGSGDPQMLLTTTGSFRTDDEGYLTTDSGLVLMGWPADENGDIPTYSRDTSDGLEPVQINFNELSGSPTTEMTLGLNLPATETESDAEGEVFDLSVEYFDNLGKSESLNITFTPTVPASGSSNEWTMELTDSATGSVVGEYTLTFDDSRADGGTLASVTAVSGGAYDATTGSFIVTADSGPIEVNIGLIGESSGITQLSNSFSPLAISKDGSSVGSMTAVEVDSNGYVQAFFDTGATRTIFQIPLVDMANPNGMNSLDAQTYVPSPQSGSIFLWDAGDGPTGEIASYAREESATDVAGELTEMIQTQRAYSSNAKVIQTVDEMLQETTNIKR